jgi:DNA-binding NarL/FixJ family response regulator
MRFYAFGFSNFSVTSEFMLEGERLGTSSVRVLVVDDFEPYRCLVASILRKKPELQILCEVSDGCEAVQKAEELQPDLILLDIELPNLNGIEAASRIRQVAPGAKLVFVTQNSDHEIVAAALITGAHGYVLKTDAGSELLPAVAAVLRGDKFISSGIKRRRSRETENI